MEVFLRSSIDVPFSSLFLDPNNPRLAKEDAPGYHDASVLFDETLQKQLEKELGDVYTDFPDLMDAIVAQGWMPIDAIVVWTYPSDPNKHIVLEGNTRTLALRRLRRSLAVEEKKLEAMRKPRAGVAAHDIEAHQRKIAQIQKVITDTEVIRVIPLDASSVEELLRKLPRVMAVRHIQGAKGWGNYAEDLWVLDRYEALFREKYPTEDLRWEDTLINKVAAENSLGKTKAKRSLQALSAYSHFKAEYAHKLPPEERFESSDYYLFENIVKKPFLREQFGLGQDALFLTREDVIFEWIFKLPRPKTARDNPNKFYRHENVLVWDQMHRYDIENKTDFSRRFNVEEPENAPTMFEVEADFNNFRARRQPTDIMDSLLTNLGELKVEVLLNQASFLEPLLKKLIELASKLLNMIAGAKAPAA